MPNLPFRFVKYGRTLENDAASQTLRALRSGPYGNSIHVLLPRRRTTCHERNIMFRIIWIISTYVRAFTRRFMPTSVLLDWLRSRRGLKWGVPAMLLAVPYLLVAVWCSGAIERGASGWLNLVILLCIWNAMKFIVMGPVSLVALLKLRHREKRFGVVATPEFTPNG